MVHLHPAFRLYLHLFLGAVPELTSSVPGFHRVPKPPLSRYRKRKAAYPGTALPVLSPPYMVMTGPISGDHISWKQSSRGNHSSSFVMGFSMEMMQGEAWISQSEIDSFIVAASIPSMPL